MALMGRSRCRFLTPQQTHNPEMGMRGEGKKQWHGTCCTCALVLTAMIHEQAIAQQVDEGEQGHFTLTWNPE